ncbi:MAG: NADH-quinone oxidoreductase subunit C [Chloroflexi bacterium]|nr:NADH-quinone oxidoreductase subunit C [Chloroflexota bacterium]MCI0768950.1 NADH-quinone oxidoreductase subunit C [Chloroflexota bacterium]
MTRRYPADDLAGKIRTRFPDAVADTAPTELYLERDRLRDVCEFLRDDEALDFRALVALNAVDYVDYFEVVYRLVSYRHNHATVLKVRVYERDEPSVPSVTSVWKGAELQEREVYDLMGVGFDGHPNLKRVFLWEGFEGHPLRRDFLLQRP